LSGFALKRLTFYRHSLVERAPAGEDAAGWRPKARLVTVADFIARMAKEGRTLVVTNKRVRCALTGENGNGRLPVSGQYAGADIAHFGNIRGTNEFKDHEIVIILGREQPSVRDAERRAMAIWYDTTKPIRCIKPGPGVKRIVQYPNRACPHTLRDGSQLHVDVRVHPDRRVQAVVEQTREAEMVQAIDRLRLIQSAREKTVYILCNIPLAILVDELITWRELVGDNRLAKALEMCEEKDLEALPLPAEKLSELFPELWGTAKAAERWRSKNPLGPYISIIRVWGVIVEYKPKQQRPWSRALVRHGADPRTALAAVLGVDADDLHVKDGGAPTANTTPSRPPTRDPNPNPNAEPGRQPTNRLRKKSRFWKNGHETGSQREPRFN